MTTLRALLLCMTAGLAGCATRVDDIGRAPRLTPVGSGLVTGAVPQVHAPAHRPRYLGGNSVWQDGGGDLFRDPRAMKPGDVVTVKILIKDRASLANSTNRKRESTRDVSGNFDFDMNTSGVPLAANGNVTAAVDGNTETKGGGGISRSETIDLLVAAVVTDVLPNGNLVISGTQEVRVNFEVRELSVAGIVRPRDISTDNAISYDKIAEARISYGGRGRVMEVQQPALGHQITDFLLPF